jgi:alkanesulfonate monooxygenase SsuD/methylene tetrahydromethanopterin reductase-like flavin-dependent oxidoreductase (luciferase family)
VQRPKVPVIIGGGPRRTPALAAKYADEFNAAFKSPADAEAGFNRVRDACTEAGRDPASIAFSAAQVVCCGSGEAEIARRAASIGRKLPELRENGIAGSPSEVVDKIGAFADAGATTVYLQILDLADLDHLELLASEVLPRVLFKTAHSMFSCRWLSL